MNIKKIQRFTTKKMRKYLIKDEKHENNIYNLFIKYLQAIREYLKGESIILMKEKKKLNHEDL